KLEYSFTVHAGADPSQIHLQFAGADSITTNGAGDLVLHTAAGDVTESAPVFVQQAQQAVGDGALAQSPVTGGYVVNVDNTVGIQVSGYDSTQDLTIDPVISWSATFGATGNGVATDGAGNSYVVGNTGTDVIAQKYDPSGTLISTMLLIGS